MILSIIIPVYNECVTLETLLRRIDVLELKDIQKEVIIVDDGSTDGSREFLRQKQQENPDYHIIFHERNSGKGAAIQTGLKVVSGDAVIIQDADLEYDPEDFRHLLKPLIEEDLKVVYGSRLLDPRNRRHASLPAYIGARLITLTTNLLYGTRLTDEPTCYKLFKTEVLQGIGLRAQGFDFCPEVTAKLAKLKIPIQEVPIRYSPRSRAQGKKIGFRDFFQALWVLFRERLGFS